MRKLLPLLFVVSCGPSFQTIYENDARFEHCYALDDSATARLERKANCWKDWKERHTYGQRATASSTRHSHSSRSTRCRICRPTKR